MEIKASSKFEYASIKALTHLSLYKKSKPRNRLILWVIILAVLIAIIIIEMVLFSDTSLIGLLSLGAFLTLYECYLYFLLPRIRYNALQRMKNTENEYIFYDDLLKINTKSNGYNGVAEVQYSLFVKVYETSRFIFLYQTKNQVFLVDKSTIEDSGIDIIREKLSSILNSKYILCKY